jgi:hypothetical protein
VAFRAHHLAGLILLAVAGCSQSPSPPTSPALLLDQTTFACWAGDCTGTFIGASPEGSVQLQNKGTQTLNITAVSAPSDPAFTISLSDGTDAGLTPPFSIAGERTGFVGLTFTPTQAKAYSSTVTITSNSIATTVNGAQTCGPTCVLTLTGTGVAYPAPRVDNINPNVGPPQGGTAVTIQGANFLPDAGVAFGALQATSVVVSSSGEITAITPAQGTGIVSVVVTNTTGLTSDGGVTFSYCVPVDGGAC